MRVRHDLLVVSVSTRQCRVKSEKRKVSLSIKLLEEIQKKKLWTNTVPKGLEKIYLFNFIDKLKKKDKEKIGKNKLPITKSELVKQLSKTYPNIKKKI